MSDDRAGHFPRFFSGPCCVIALSCWKGSCTYRNSTTCLFSIETWISVSTSFRFDTSNFPPFDPMQLRKINLLPNLCAFLQKHCELSSTISSAKTKLAFSVRFQHRFIIVLAHIIRFVRFSDLSGPAFFQNFKICYFGHLNSKNAFSKVWCLKQLTWILVSLQISRTV